MDKQVRAWIRAAVMAAIDQGMSEVEIVEMAKQVTREEVAARTEATARALYGRQA